MCVKPLEMANLADPTPAIWHPDTSHKIYPQKPPPRQLEAAAQPPPTGLQKITLTSPQVRGAPAAWEALLVATQMQSPTTQARPPAYLLALRDLVFSGAPLAQAVAAYLGESAVGQSPNTFAAKCRDLVRFVRWFIGQNDHAEPSQWLIRDTRMHLRFLEQEGLAPGSINRALASLRHFARWLHDQPGGVFLQSGVPTRGVRELTTEEPDAKKLDDSEVHALFKAADNLVTLAGHSRARPQRNRAILAVLYFTGLRVQELCSLTLAQYDGTHLHNITRKGRVRTKSLYLVAECRRQLDSYLACERPRDAVADQADSLLLTATGTALARRDVARALDLLAAEASKRRRAPIALHAHRLRHTFGSQYREKCQSDTETAAALGHTSLKYVGRYVRKTAEERQQTLDELFGA
jgi:site-specific recombinase XerD